MQNSAKKFLKKISVLLITAMVLSLSACGGTEPASTTGTAATEATTTAAETTAAETTTAAEETTVAATEEIVVEMAPNQVYDGTFDLIAVPDNPGCEYPADQGNVGGNGAGRIALAGEPYVFIGDDGKKLGISNRVNAWDSIDVTLGGLEDGNYSLEAVFSANEAMDFTIEDADSPWGVLASGNGTEATLTFDFEVKDGKYLEQNRLRLKEATLNNYYVNSIKLFVAEAPAEPMEELPGTLVYEALEDMQAYADPDNLPGCDYPADQGTVGVAGAGRLATAGEPYVFLGEGSKGIGISNRVNTWDSVDVTLGDLEPGDYTLQVKFTSSQPLTFAIENADTPWGALASSEEGTEAILTYDFTLDETGVWNNPDGVQNRFRLNSTPLETYYIENIRIYKAE